MERNQILIIKEFLDKYESPVFDSILVNEFEELKILTNNLRHFKGTVEGERECNRKKNRYRDIVPCKSPKQINLTKTKFP